jgi:antitoxin component YwqK of YwqJK toxin-antitoxin module
MKSILFSFLVFFKLISAFSQNVADTFPLLGTKVERFFDESNKLSFQCEYDSFNGRLERERIYFSDGRLKREEFSNGSFKFVSEFSDSLNRYEYSVFRLDGSLYWEYEDENENRESKYIAYYPNGVMEEKGHMDWVDQYIVSGFTKVSVGKKLSTTPEGKTEAQVGEWCYYYSNGNDSALGNYADVAYECDTTFPSILTEVYLATGSTEYFDVKDGTWNYFSPDGKLICSEEWEKGNLLRRKTF